VTSHPTSHHAEPARRAESKHAKPTSFDSAASRLAQDEARGGRPGDPVPDVVVRTLAPDEVDAYIPALADILVDCVAGGASVSFMAPFPREKAEAFWSATRDRVLAGGGELLVAELDGAAVGTVQVVWAGPENQPHRADVAKLLVHRRARGHGIGQALMQAVEDRAQANGKTVLVLDTASDAAEHIYRRLGWIEVGRVPDYALYPDGRFCDTIIFYKRIAPEDQRA
jgi:GNAT superfamily N-acetyltransferase